MKVLHINDTHGIPSVLASTAPPGMDLEIIPLERVSDRSWSAKVAQRARDRRAIRGPARRADIIHVHYGLHALLVQRAACPLVVHLHGSDLHTLARKAVMGYPVRRIIRTADAAVYSTPDLKKYLDPIRTDGIFIPNPVRMEYLDADLPPGGDGILWYTRFDPVKKIESALKLLTAFNQDHPDVPIRAFRWGTSIPQVGWLELLKPFEDVEEGIRELQRHRVIVGQFGSLGLSELEAMALGKPVVARCDYGDAYVRSPPLVRPTVEAISETYFGRTRIGADGEDWVRQTHTAEVAWSLLSPLYNDLAR